MVVLNKGGGYACLSVAFGVIGFHKEAAVVAKELWNDDPDIWQGGGMNLHERIFLFIEIFDFYGFIVS